MHQAGDSTEGDPRLLNKATHLIFPEEALHVSVRSRVPVLDDEFTPPMANLRKREKTQVSSQRVGTRARGGFCVRKSQSRPCVASAETPQTLESTEPYRHGVFSYTGAPVKKPNAFSTSVVAAPCAGEVPAFPLLHNFTNTDLSELSSRLFSLLIKSRTSTFSLTAMASLWHIRIAGINTPPRCAITTGK